MRCVSTPYHYVFLCVHMGLDSVHDNKNRTVQLSASPGELMVPYVMSLDTFYDLQSMINVSFPLYIVFTPVFTLVFREIYGNARRNSEAGVEPFI